jgi:hypothetical protein
MDYELTPLQAKSSRPFRVHPLFTAATRSMLCSRKHPRNMDGFLSTFAGPTNVAKWHWIPFFQDTRRCRACTPALPPCTGRARPLDRGHRSTFFRRHDRCRRGLTCDANAAQEPAYGRGPAGSTGRFLWGSHIGPKISRAGTLRAVILTFLHTRRTGLSLLYLFSF